MSILPAIGEDIFYLTGEIHDGRKAGFMKFSSPEARQEYITMTTRDLLPNDATINGAKEIAQAMRDKCKGRQCESLKVSAPHTLVSRCPSTCLLDIRHELAYPPGRLCRSSRLVSGLV